MIRNRIAAAGLAVGLVGGGIAGAVLGVPALVGAQDGATTTTEAPTTTEATTTTEGDDTSTTEAPAEDEAPSTTEAPDESTTTAPPADDDDAPRPGKGRWLEDALAPLVENGTLTQEQADQVIEALKAAKPERGGRGHGGRGGHGFFGLRGGFDLDAAASALGLDLDALRDALRDGGSIKDLAASQGVDVQQVVDALLAQMKTRLDEKVAEGDLTQDEANQKLLRMGERINAFVNGELPAMPDRPKAPAGPEGD